jgi:hypothetical protein
MQYYEIISRIYSYFSALAFSIDFLKLCKFAAACNYECIMNILIANIISNLWKISTHCEKRISLALKYYYISFELTCSMWFGMICPSLLILCVSNLVMTYCNIFLFVFDFLIFFLKVFVVWFSNSSNLFFYLSVAQIFAKMFGRAGQVLCDFQQKADSSTACWS